jgi:hypothetical protein
MPETGGREVRLFHAVCDFLRGLVCKRPSKCCRPCVTCIVNMSPWLLQRVGETSDSDAGKGVRTISCFPEPLFKLTGLSYSDQEEVPWGREDGRLVRHAFTWSLSGG